MKYWFLATEYPPQYGGGIGTYVYYTARMLRDNGHDVTIFIYDLSLSNNKITVNNNLRLIRFVPNKTKTSSFLGFNACISYEYAQIVGEYVKKEGKPDIIESQEYQGIAYYLQQFKWLNYEGFSNLDILITCHAPAFLYLEYNHVPVYQFPHYWTSQMEKSSIRSADLLISPSHYLIRELKNRMNWNGVHEQYLLNPIETDPAQIAQTYKENYIVCFGKLSPLKGTFHLLKYFKELWDNGFIHPLHIVGGTQQLFHPEELTMEEIVKKEYGGYIEKNLLKLEGELSPENAKKKLLDAHLILVPSIVDNLPYTVLEAMSWGKVILSSCQGGQSELIIDGENGFLFDHFTVNDFQSKLLHILNLKPDCITKIGENAICTINKSCSPEKVYSEKIKIINDFLRREKKQPVFPFVQNAINPGEKKIVPDCFPDELLSVVIPYYNMGDYIEECVRSVVRSDYLHKEIIIINDGSTDSKSIAALSQVEKKYPVSVYHKKNEGLSITRNFGAGKATGKYMAFLDADDTVEESYYSKAIKVLASYDNVHFVGCWVKYFGDNNECWPAFNPEPPYLLLHNMINSSALVYKKEAFLMHGLNVAELVYGMEDWDSVINLVKNNCGGVVLPEVLYNYRIRKHSMARGFTRIKQLHLYRLIGNRHKDLYNAYGNEVAQLLNANGSGIGFDNPTKESNLGPLAGLQLTGLLKEKIKHRIKRNKYLKQFAYKIYKQLKN
ncbi:MAG TPA: glycosyltransferase [Chitinophagaceae bacterium]